MTDDFADLFPEDSEVVHLAPGEELFRKGDAGLHLFVVKAGALQVLDGNHVFATVEPGGIVGEMALVGDKVRSATVRSVGETAVIAVDEKRFLFLVRQTPFFAIRVMRVISDRLKAMNRRATSLEG